MVDAASLRQRDNLETRQGECGALQFAIGVPKRRTLTAAELEEFAAPDPYAEGIKALREAR